MKIGIKNNALAPLHKKHQQISLTYHQEDKENL